MSDKIVSDKEQKDRIVPFPESFRETLALYTESSKQKETSNLFESNWAKPYSDRAIGINIVKWPIWSKIYLPINCVIFCLLGLSKKA